MMKTKLAALAGTLALTLMMSTLWAAPPPGGGGGPDLGAIQPSDLGVVPDESDNLHGNCPAGTREFPGTFQQLGEPGGNVEVFTVDGIDVTITITKDGTGQDESISFFASGGWVHNVLVKPGNFYFHYNYFGFGPPDPDTGLPSGKVQSDGSLNEREGGRSQEVSHIDWCLSPGEPFTSTIAECATPEGCDPSGRQLNNYPLALAGQGFDNETVTQKPLIATAQDTTCGLDPSDGVTVINPYIARDCRVDVDGTLLTSPLAGCPIVNGRLNLTQLFDFSEWLGVPGPDGTCDPGEICYGVWFDANDVGTPCIAGLKGTNSAGFHDFFEAQVPLDDWTATVTQNDAVWGAFTVLQPGPVSDNDGFRDLSWIEQGVLQVDDLGIRSYPEDHAGAFTWQVINPKLLKSGGGTVYWFLMREACVNVGPQPDDLTVPSAAGVAYLQAVEDCKVQLAIEYLDNMETVLENADSPERDAMIESINFYQTPLNKIRNMFNNRNFSKAINDANQFCDRVIGTNWIVFPENDPGSLSMRCANIAHRAEELLIAEGIKNAWIKAL